MSTSYKTIFADFLLHCRQVKPPNPWGAFSKGSDFREPPQDEEATLTALRKKYGEKKLINSHVATYGVPAGGWGMWVAGQRRKELMINPLLSTPFARFLPLRTSPQGKPFDLLTGAGTISGRLPACAALHDHKVEAAIKKMGILCLTFSMEDLMALRSVGIPTSLARGLEKITRETFGELCGSLGFGSADASTHLNDECTQGPPTADLLAEVVGSCNPPPLRPRLFLVGWEVSRMSRHHPGEVDEVVRSLANVSDCLEIDLDDVFLWQPPQKDLRRIRYCLSIGERKDVQDSIFGSLRRSAKLVTQAEGDADAPSGLLETRRRLQEALLRSGTSPADRRRRLQLYRHAIDASLVAPLVEQATAELDPKKRSHLAGLAQINQVLYPAVELYMAKRDKEVAKRGVDAWDAVSDVRDLMKMFDILFKFTQESE
jgi:hypothetical protein